MALTQTDNGFDGAQATRPPLTGGAVSGILGSGGSANGCWHGCRLHMISSSGVRVTSDWRFLNSAAKGSSGILSIFRTAGELFVQLRKHVAWTHRVTCALKVKMVVYRRCRSTV